MCAQIVNVLKQESEERQSNITSLYMLICGKRNKGTMRMFLYFDRGVGNLFEAYLISVRLQVLQEELEAQRARARGESSEAWGVNRTDEDKDVVRATQVQMNYSARPSGGKNNTNN